ncbi:hypothetical protein K0M31_017714 [Melipona bicolor]|uniref:Uncharacterized protein n=1 Tax=Melipona bicolor TaxID=60889 RepID=A0AA40KSQ1_9HYME|nr:hypothetical protein K0M31_017714 [Melipona bicolor]
MNLEAVHRVFIERKNNDKRGRQRGYRNRVSLNNSFERESELDRPIKYSGWLGRITIDLSSPAPFETSRKLDARLMRPLDTANHTTCSKRNSSQLFLAERINC